MSSDRCMIFSKQNSIVGIAKIELLVVMTIPIFYFIIYNYILDGFQVWTCVWISTQFCFLYKNQSFDLQQRSKKGSVTGQWPDESVIWPDQIFYSRSFRLWILWHSLTKFHCSIRIYIFYVSIDTVYLKSFCKDI